MPMAEQQGLTSPLVRGGRGTAGQPKGGAGPVAAGASF